MAHFDEQRNRAGRPENNAANTPDTDDAGSLSQDVIDVFLADTPTQLEKLRTRLADEDMEGVRSVAHYLKGSAMYLGLQRMRELCQGIEMLTVLNGGRDAADIVCLLEAEFTRIRSQLAGQRQAAKGNAAGGR